MVSHVLLEARKMSRIVRFRVSDGDSHITTLDLDREGEDGIVTYHDLFDYLKSKGYINEDHSMLLWDGTPVDDMDEAIEFGMEVMKFEWRAINIYVKDLDITQVIRAGMHSSVGDVKKSYLNETRKNVPELSFRGKNWRINKLFLIWEFRIKIYCKGGSLSWWKI